MTPETHFAQNGSVNIAYQIFGHGPRDLIIIPGWVSNLDIFWEEPAAARVSGTASGDEILVSRTVRDLVAGSGIELEEFGTHSFKGIPDEHRLFKVIAPLRNG